MEIYCKRKNVKIGATVGCWASRYPLPQDSKHIHSLTKQYKISLVRSLQVNTTDQVTLVSAAAKQEEGLQAHVCFCKDTPALSKLAWCLGGVT